MAFSGGWLTIESDLGMFTNHVGSSGVRGAELAELWSPNYYYLRSLASNYGDVYSPILLFKWHT